VAFTGLLGTRDIAQKARTGPVEKGGRRGDSWAHESGPVPGLPQRLASQRSANRGKVRIAVGRSIDLTDLPPDLVPEGRRQRPQVPCQHEPAWAVDDSDRAGKRPSLSHVES
jgi:hypothetical protein